MKKITLLFALVSLVFISSCKKESYYHWVALAHPTANQVAVVAADQTLDSVLFYTTDKTFISPVSSSWISIDEDKKVFNVENYYRYVWLVSTPLNFAPNTTGEPRKGTVQIHSVGEDDWDATCDAVYFQLSWHDITMPAPKYSYKDSEVIGAVFEATDSATQVADTLKFVAYGNWTLTDGSFAHPQSLAGEPGEQKVIVRLDENTATTDRDEEISLSSNGVATKVKFIQTAK